MYAWMARWVQQAPADVKMPEKGYSVEPLSDLLVFHQRALPADAVTAAQLTDGWIAAARRQLGAPPSTANAAALRHALGLLPSAGAAGVPAFNRTVLVAHSDPAVGKALASAGFSVRPLTFTPFDEAAAAKVRHFETYNQTAAGRRVEEVVAAVNANPGAAIVADGDAALAALLAVSGRVRAGGRPRRRAIRHVERRVLSRTGSTSRASAAPAICRRRASLARGKLVLHNAGDRFAISGPDKRAAQLTPAEIAAVLRR